MKFEIEIDQDDLNNRVADLIASELRYQARDKTDEIFKKIDWSKMTPHVQDAILKMAAEELFGRNKR
jgi:hypothetical protein